MNQDQFAAVSESMANELVKGLEENLTEMYTKYGAVATNTCFGNALAIATGNVLSAYCMACMPDRKAVFKLFEVVMRASAKEHKEWKISKSN